MNRVKISQRWQVLKRHAIRLVSKYSGISRDIRLRYPFSSMKDELNSIVLSRFGRWKLYKLYLSIRGSTETYVQETFSHLCLMWKIFLMCFWLSLEKRLYVDQVIWLTELKKLLIWKCSHFIIDITLKMDSIQSGINCRKWINCILVKEKGLINFFY